MSIQQQIEEIRRLAEDKMAECCSGLEHDYGTCAAGCSDGYVPDPASGPLLEVVRERCSHWGKISTDGGFYQQSECPACGGSGFITRSWEGLPKGALRGAIEDAVEDAPFASNYFHIYNQIIEAELLAISKDKEGEDRWALFSKDAAACDAVIKALKGE